MGLSDLVSAGISHRIASLLAVKGRDVYSISPYATVFEAIGELARRNIGSLVVLDNGRLIGVFSERDYTRNVALKGRASRDTRVLDVMSERLVTVSPDETIGHCMHLMTDKRIRHLPVVEDGRVVGVISIGDLVNVIIKAQSETIQQLQGYISGNYPG